MRYSDNDETSVISNDFAPIMLVTNTLSEAKTQSCKKSIITWQRIDSAVDDNGARFDPVASDHFGASNSHDKNISTKYLK